MLIMYFNLCIADIVVIIVTYRYFSETKTLEPFYYKYIIISTKKVCCIECIYVPTNTDSSICMTVFLINKPVLIHTQSDNPLYLYLNKSTEFVDTAQNLSTKKR